MVRSCGGGRPAPSAAATTGGCDGSRRPRGHRCLGKRSPRRPLRRAGERSLRRPCRRGRQWRPPSLLPCFQTAEVELPGRQLAQGGGPWSCAAARPGQRRHPSSPPMPVGTSPPSPPASTANLPCVPRRRSWQMSAVGRIGETGTRRLWRLGLCKIPDTHYPYTNYPNLRYPIPSSDSDCHYPKLVWVIRVIHSSTQTTRTT
jgi:hypothetical protein